MRAQVRELIPYDNVGEPNILRVVIRAVADAADAAEPLVDWDMEVDAPDIEPVVLGECERN